MIVLIAACAVSTIWSYVDMKRSIKASEALTAYYQVCESMPGYKIMQWVTYVICVILFALMIVAMFGGFGHTWKIVAIVSCVWDTMMTISGTFLYRIFAGRTSSY